MRSAEHDEYLPNTEAGRALFRERLIAKIQRHRDFKRLPEETRSVFIQELAAFTAFDPSTGGSIRARGPRLRRLEKLADSYRRVAHSIALLTEAEKLLLDDDFQHGISLQKQENLMRHLAVKVDNLIAGMGQTTSGASERFLLRLQGERLLDQLEKLGIECKINNNFQKVAHGDGQAGATHHYLPDLSQSTTLAMLCTMLALFDNGQIVDWSFCRRLLREGQKAKAIRQYLSEPLPLAHAHDLLELAIAFDSHCRE